jgi:hypothetical protein
MLYGSIDSGTKNILTNFTAGVGGSAWWAINKGYSGVGSLPLKYIVTDTSYSAGTYFTTQTIWNYIASLINRGYLPADYNGIYMVVTSR